MLEIVSSMITLRKLQNNGTTIKEKWCKEQEEDFMRIVSMVDDLIAQAVCASSSQHTFIQLQEAKKTFLSEFLEMCERYRHIG